MSLNASLEVEEAGWKKQSRNYGRYCPSSLFW